MYQLYNIKTETIENVIKEDVLDKIYYLEYRLPTPDEIKNKLSKKKLMELNAIDENDAIEIIKKAISKIENKVPLYDAYTENIYLIGKHNVYNRVIHQSYRFPEKELIDELNEKNINIDDKILDEITKRKHKKIKLMINFMNNFDIETLFETYVKVFYKYSEFAGKEITVCKNPSFYQQFIHIKPYMTRTEIINMALNLNMKIPKDIYIEQNEIMEICKKIKKYQINFNTLLNHQTHIIKGGHLGLVQYYTLQGSYFMNQYLRNMTTYDTKNEYLETIIEPMWNIILTSPEFDQSYVLYRFVQEDNFLKNINIGDIYIENGFMSTTRDPFYRSDLYKFGFILVKIKIPPHKKGIALCLESVSHFPKEQEIIFPPKSKFKLISRDENCIYYHTDLNFSSKIKTKYEFEWIENEQIKFDRKKINTHKNIVDFMTITKPKVHTLEEKINYFETNYVNNMGQFFINLKDLSFTVISEKYDSTSAYKDFYGIETKNGYSFYTMYKGYILFFIEIGKEIHINYYVKYSSIDTNTLIGDDNMINFFSSIAYYFDIPVVIVYANYLNCNIITINQQIGGNIQRNFSQHITKNTQKNTISYELINGSYCVDFFNYLANGKKKYSDIGVLNVELQPKFSYRDLDKLKKFSPKLILLKEDRDELYQIYDKFFKQIAKTDTISEFYIWLKENKCYLIEQFVVKIDRLIEITNPFRNDVYILDPFTYLYNRKQINTYPTFFNINPEIKRNVLKEDVLNLRQK